jgi:general secretion pathway protein A
VINSYTEYFEFIENPFKRTPDTQFYFLSKSHKSALEVLQYLMASDDEFAMLTAPSGYGKTVLLRIFASQLPANVKIVSISFPYMQPKELLFAVLEDLNIDYDPQMSTNALYSKFRDFLLKQHENGSHVVLVLEEAQDISDETLEALRILSNLETDKKKLLKIIISGQPEMKNRLYKLGDLKQRVALVAEIGTLVRDETMDYINHYLAIAGGKKLSISKNLANIIWAETKGNPRLVNMLMERALVAAFMDKSPTIRRVHVESAAKSINMLYESTSPSGVSLPLSKLFIPAMMLVLLGAGGYIAYDKLFATNSPRQLVYDDPQPVQPTPPPIVITPDPEPVTPDPIVEPDPVEPDPIVDPVLSDPIEPVVVEPVVPTLPEGWYGIGNRAMVRRSANSLNVRATPSTDGARVGGILGGQVIVVIDETEDWIKLDLNATTQGWVIKTYMEHVE